MILLLLAAILWVLLHAIVAGPMRAGLIGRMGESAYLGLFSLLSAISLAALIWAYIEAPRIAIWPHSPATALVPLVIMPVALVLFVGSLRVTNPTMAGAPIKGELPIIGMTKITRHPMLWAFSLWAMSHMIAAGDMATLLLAGAILVTALKGMWSIDRKRAAVFGDRWSRFAAQTSIIPFAAAGRTHIRFADIGWVNIIIAAAAYAVLLWLHDKLFGVPAMPAL